MVRVAMMPGHRAGEGGEHRHEGAPLQTRAGHHPVHEERGAGHVPDGFEQRDEQEQQHDLREEHQGCPHPADDAVADQARQRGVGDARGQRGELVEARLHEVLDGRGDGEDHLEEAEHHHEEDQRAPQRMQQHGVDALGAGVATSGSVAGGREDGLRPGVELLAFRRRRHHRARPGLGAGHQRPQRFGPLAGGADDPADGHTQRRGQSVEVQRSAPRLQLVGHRDDHHGSAPEREDLRNQGHGPRERGGVHHHRERVGRCHVGVPAGQHVGDDLLVGADRAERVRPGQVLENRVRMTRDTDQPHGARHGDSRVVARLGPQPGEVVEDAGLPRVGAADQRHPGALADEHRSLVARPVAVGAHAGSSTTYPASRRRRQISEQRSR